MNTQRINQILFNNNITKPFYIGCLPCNYSPNVTKFPVCFVFNLDDSSQKGSHWVGVYAKNFSNVYYFDSFGEAPTQCIKQSLLKFGIIYYNKFCFQSPFSDVCAYYAIFFIYSLCSNVKFENFLKILKRQKEPDLYVKSFTKTFYYKKLTNN